MNGIGGGSGFCLRYSSFDLKEQGYPVFQLVVYIPGGLPEKITGFESTINSMRAFRTRVTLVINTDVPSATPTRAVLESG